MLNIRVNLNIDLKKVAIIVSTVFLTLQHLVAPASAAVIKEFQSHETKVSVALTYLNVSTTKTQAIDALNSPYAKYFDPETLAFLTTYSKGMSMGNWKCLRNLWQSESHFNPHALNMGSKAYGIAQFLPVTWENYKLEKTSVAAKQIEYGLHYIQVRYGNACNAWAFHKKHGWY
jgi:hypothetical protein